VLNPYLIKGIHSMVKEIINNYKNSKNIIDLNKLINEYCFAKLNNNIKWLSSEIKPDDSQITNFIEMLYEYQN
jgi:hypothetical protein